MVSNLINKVAVASSYNKDKSDKLGEVFTPYELIDEMLDQIPQEYFSDPTKTFFDPCAGKGNFPVKIIERLMIGLEAQFPNKLERYKHIVENQLFMAEYQEESCEFIRQTFNPDGRFRLNLYQGDTLQMPEDYFNR